MYRRTALACLVAALAPNLLAQERPPYRTPPIGGERQDPRTPTPRRTGEPNPEREQGPQRAYPPRSSYRTWARQAWARECSPKAEHACVLERDFSRLFPRGLAIGDSDGLDGDRWHGHVLRNAAEVRTAVASRGSDRTLEQDGSGAPADAVGELVGNLIAAKLNIAVNGADTRTAGPVDINALVFGRNVDAALIDRSVAEVVRLADRAVSGEFGHDPAGQSSKRDVADVDGDGAADVSLRDLSRALFQFNASFDRSSSAAVAVALPTGLAGAGDGSGTEPGGDETAPPPPVVVDPGEPAPGPKEGGSAPGRGTPPSDGGDTPVPGPTGGHGDEPCFCTYTQGGWGQTCSGQNVGCLRDQLFPLAFPNGLVLGDPDGIDSDGSFALLFQSSAAVAAFLPQGGAPGSLTADGLNPASSSAGVLAGQLLAAKLNSALDASGIGPCGPNRLGFLAFTDCVAGPLLGRRVSDVIRIADDALAGRWGDLSKPPAHSQPVIDVDGDGSGDVSLAEVTDALARFNQSFPNCATSSPCVGAAGDVAGGGPPYGGGAGEVPPGPEDSEAYREYRREMEKATAEYERELEQARAEAEREGKPEKYTEKERELTRKYQEKVSKIERKYMEKTGHEPPAYGRGGGDHPGQGRGRGRGDDDHDDDHGDDDDDDDDDDERRGKGKGKDKDKDGD